MVSGAARRCHTRPVLLTPIPGTDRPELLRSLRQFEADAVNSRNRLGQLPPFQTYYQYLEWASACVRTLHGRVQQAEALALFQTRRYELLLNVGNNHDIARILMEQELDDRVQVLKVLREDLGAEFMRWTTPGRLVVFDTNVYMEHPHKLEEIDLAAMLDEPDRPIHLVAPIAVVDELDNLKNRGHDNKKYRAAYSLAVLDRVISSRDTYTIGGITGHLLHSPVDTKADTTANRRAPITVELLLDPPDHIQLPNTDDEIVDRAMSIQSLAGKSVTMVSYDTGMIMRARSSGLEVVKLVKH